MKRVVIVFLALGAFAYIAAVIAAFTLQRSLLFPRPSQPRAPRVADADTVEIPMGASHTVALHAAAPDGAPTLVFFHGNGEQLADDAWLVHEFHRRGFGVLAVEYPGYGIAPGEPTKGAILEAARAAITYLRARGTSTDQIVAVGQSLGTGVAVAMAAEGRVSKLVLISPYTSTPELAQRLLPWLPARWLVRDRFESDAIATRVTAPALVFHGDRDEVIPFEMGQRLATTLHARFVPLPGLHHNDIWLDATVIDRIAAFAHP